MKRIILTFGLVLTGLALFGQSPRIRLNQITKDSLTGSVVLSGSDSNMVYSRDFFLNLTDSVLILFGDTLSTTATAFTGVATDLTLTGNGTVGNELKVDTSVIATIKAISDSLAALSFASLQDITDTLDLNTRDYITGLRLTDTLNTNSRGFLTQNQTITLTDDATGTGTTSISVSVVDDSHNHTISTLTGIQDSLNSKAALVHTHTISDVAFLQDSLDAKANDADLNNYLLTSNYIVDSTRINLTGDTAYYYQNGVLIGTGAIAGGGGGGSGTVTDITAGTFLIGGTITTSGTIALDTASAGLKTYISENSAGGTTFNNLSETADTVYVAKFLNVDTATLYVDAVNNRVGIGTTTPASKLHVIGGIEAIKNSTFPVSFTQETSLTNQLRGTIVGNALCTGDMQDGFGAAITFQIQDNTSSMQPIAYFGGFRDGSDVAGGLSFFTATGLYSYIERLTIKSDGKVGIGTTAPAYRLDVNGDVRADTYYYDVGSSLVSSSDVRLKKNVSTMQSTLNKIKALNLVKYEWNDIMFNKLEGRSSQSKLSGIFEGMIAQEVESIFPQYVGQDADGFKTLSYVSFIVPLIKAIQEQQAIIESQQSEIETLKTQYNDLLQRIINLENK